MRSTYLVLFFYALTLLSLFPLVFFRENPSRPHSSDANAWIPLVTIGIKTSSRPILVERLLNSIQKFAPGVQVVVVDDGAQNLTLQGVYEKLDVIQIEEDAGLAAGRNALLDAIDTPFMIYFDDDFVMTSSTRWLAMIQFLIMHHGVDIVGGLVSDRPNWGFRFRLHGKILDQTNPDPFPLDKACKIADIVPNFFAARLRSLKDIRWDEHFKLGEHEDFFLRAMGRLSIVTCNFSSVQHKPQTVWYTNRTSSLSAYERKRRRALGFMQDFLQKHGIEKYYTSDKVLLASNEEMLRPKVKAAATLAKKKLDMWMAKNSITVVILSWQRRKNVLDILKYMRSLDEGQISEVLIWNNDPSAGFFVDSLLVYPFSVRVFNSEENLNTLARWKACATLASNPLCFFIDDDFLPSTFHQLLYTYNWYPNHFIAATNVKVFWNNLRWAFEESEWGIHTGFSWLGSGSIVSRSRAQLFLQRVTQSVQSKYLAVVDNYFSFWENKYPCMMMARLEIGTLDQNSAYSIGNQVLNKLREARIDAVNILRKKKSKSYRLKQTLESEMCPVFAAALDQRGVFFTNKRPARVKPSDISQLKDPNLWSYIHLSQEANEEDLKRAFDHHVMHSPLAAVDGDIKTYWESQSQVKKGDYFGLDLTRVQKIRNIQLISHIDHQELLTQISSDGKQWFEYNLMARAETFSCTSIAASDCTIISVSTPDFEARFVKFIAGWDFPGNFKVWEVSVY